MNGKHEFSSDRNKMKKAIKTIQELRQLMCTI